MSHQAHLPSWYLFNFLFSKSFSVHFSCSSYHLCATFAICPSCLSMFPSPVPSCTPAFLVSVSSFFNVLFSFLHFFHLSPVLHLHNLSPLPLHASLPCPIMHTCLPGTKYVSSFFNVLFRFLQLFHLSLERCLHNLSHTPLHASLLCPVMHTCLPGIK